MTTSTLPINKKFNYHSFIGGGNGNSINADCGAILGGSGNTVNHAWSAVFGNGLTTAATNTFYTECLNAINTPSFIGLGTFAPGTLQRHVLATACLGLPAGTSIVVIE